jgi:hypothetical protein
MMFAAMFDDEVPLIGQLSVVLVLIVRLSYATCDGLIVWPV